MIIPSKEEALNRNVLVQGSRIVQILRTGATTLDDIRKQYPTRRNPAAPSMERLLDILTYLHIIGMVEADGHYVSLRGKS